MAILNVTVSKDYRATVLTDIFEILFSNRGATATFESAQFSSNSSGTLIAPSATITGSALTNHMVVHVSGFFFGSLWNLVNWSAADKISLLGGATDDDIWDSMGADRIEGGDGNDILRSEEGVDTLIGGTGDDRVEIVSGEADGGLGIDTARLRFETATVGVVADLLDGGGGRRLADLVTITGFERFDLGGSAFNDTIRFGALDDQAFSGAGDDLMVGRGGDDSLAGSAGNDKLLGSAGEDWLYGDSGNDSLWGDDGADLLFGSIGRDQLTGGAGADLFVFDAPSHSGVAALRDTITDFQQGRDLIDLSVMDNLAISGDQDVRFVGQTTFRGGRMEVRYVQTATDTIIQGSVVKGEADQQFEIRLVGLYTLTAADFIL